MTEEMQTKTCPYCGEEINVSAIKCKHCGEFLEEKQEDVSGTKVCPFCGEEILASAVKCKHCGEFLNQQASEKNTSGKFAKIDVNDKWKKRFEAVDKQVVDGKWWKIKSEFWKTPISERSQLGSVLYMSDFLSSLAAYCFGSLYYICKGMWLKAIIYFLATLIIEAVVYAIYPNFSCPYVLYGILTVSFAPYDYYRLKVLGKQW